MKLGFWICFGFRNSKFGFGDLGMYTDFGYMEEGKLGKPYNLKLMTRLWVFLRAHWFLMAVSLLFVLIMAALDLFIPYLTKEAIDRYVVPSAREVVLKGDRSLE